MNKHRFFSGTPHTIFNGQPPVLALGLSLALPPSAAAHAGRVLRLEAGDHVTLFNGDGHDYDCVITSVKKNEVLVEVENLAPVNNESDLQVTLVQAISSGDRMEFTLQKAVEMGVSAIQPIITQRSVVKLSGERAEKRREHWQNVVIAACEQSGRAVMPIVAASMPLTQWLATVPQHGMRLTLSPTAELTLHDLNKPAGEIYLLIGCEGGLTADEIAMASTQGFVPIQLGKRVLRTETAGLATMAALQTLWGDY